MILFVWLKKILSRITLVQNYCKTCGRKAEPFEVSSRFWRKVVGSKAVNEELCIHCFHKKAEKQGYSLEWAVVRGRRRGENKTLLGYLKQRHNRPISDLTLKKIEVRCWKCEKAFEFETQSESKGKYVVPCSHCGTENTVEIDTESTDAKIGHK